MRKIWMIAMAMIGGFSVKAQQNKAPVIVNDAPTVFNGGFDPYAEYAGQGNRMYINNSQFYNKDNVLTNSVPQSNGLYVQPGNSNPVNTDMYPGAPAPSGTIYSGYVPVRDYGNSSQSTEGIR